MKLRLMHHFKEFQREIPANSKMLPTRLTERAAEEQMESSFLSIVVAKHTIIIVSLEFLLFSSKNISSVKPIHEHCSECMGAKTEVICNKRIKAHCHGCAV